MLQNIRPRAAGRLVFLHRGLRAPSVSIDAPALASCAIGCRFIQGVGIPIYDVL